MNQVMEDFKHELYFICNSNWDKAVKIKAIEALSSAFHPQFTRARFERFEPTKFNNCELESNTIDYRTRK